VVTFPKLTPLLPTAVCLCRLLGDPHLAQYDNDNIYLPGGSEWSTLTHKPDTACRFKVEAHYVHTNVVDFIRVTMSEDQVVVDLKAGFVVDFQTPNLPTENASLQTYTKVIGNVKISRNGDYVIVEDTSVCGHKVGWDYNDPNTRAVIVVNRDFGTYLIGQCGKCGD